MKHLDLYIAKHVLGGFLIILLVIVGLDMIFALIEELKDVRNDYDFPAAIEYILMTGPRRLYDHMPLSSLIGCLFGLGLLASSSELTVMRAAGVSTLQICLSVMKPVLAIVFITLLAGEYIVPYTESSAQSKRQIKITEGGQIHDVSQVWHRDELTFIHINAVDTDGSIRGVTRYEFNEDLTLSRSSFALSGVFDGGRWQLDSIRETRFPDARSGAIDEQKLVIDHINREEWKSGLTPELLKVVMVKPAHLQMSGLIDYSRYLDEQGLAAQQYRVAFWKKLLMPLAVFALVLIAVSFIFGPLRSVAVGQRLITGIVFGLVFKLSQDMLGNTSTVYGLPPFLAVFLPILICLVLGFWLLKRAR
ncbi:MAG: LPS export ABC transporter permease LptG [Neptuniibacter sp.]